MLFDYKFTGKKIAVLGFGVEGEAVVDFLSDKKCEIFVFDEKEERDFDAGKLQKYKEAGAQFVFGLFGDLTSFDAIIRSPGVNPNVAVLQSARQKNIPITTGIDIFLNIAPCQIIGVTGTKGKGTTSTLIYEMLKKSRRERVGTPTEASEEKSEIFLGGNIGTPPLSFLDQLTSQSMVVLELSSFQLFDVTKSPNIAVVLMVTSEHMDFHASEEEYALAKANILKFQKAGDMAVINADYENSRRIGKAARAPVYWFSRQKTISPGAYVENGAVFFEDTGGTKEKIIETNEIFIPGGHNLENVCAAVAAAKITGISNGLIAEVLRTFKGLKYRLQFMREVGGVRYYNDSFSTTPESAMAAVKAFQAPKILILGGSSKNSDFSELAKVISEDKMIKAIIGIGAEWPRIKETLRAAGATNFEIIEGCSSMGVIVETAASEAQAGDVVILSPACASFDMFEDYKDRGNQFEEAVLNLKA